MLVHYADQKNLNERTKWCRWYHSQVATDPCKSYDLRGYFVGGTLIQMTVIVRE